METTPTKSVLTSVRLSHILVRLLSFCILVFLARFAFVVTIKAQSCFSLDFGFCRQPFDFSAANSRRAYYASVFQHLVREGILSANSISLCIETESGYEVAALREIGVVNSIGISSKKLYSQHIRYAEPFDQPFQNDTFDFEFSTASGLDRTLKPVRFVLEVSRTLKPGGFFVMHTKSVRDKYRLHSLLQLLGKFTLIKIGKPEGSDAQTVHEIIVRKKKGNTAETSGKAKAKNKCPVPSYKLELIKNAEPLITEEPLKPWIMSSRNIKNVKYLPTMVDISFKNRYIYINVGMKDYGTTMANWFEKLYPKQGKQFEVYAVGADKAFMDEYRTKTGLTLLPYAAWIRNETLFFEISREQSRKNDESARIQGVQPSSNFMGNSNRIEGFDFAMWLKRTAGEMDYVVVKIDVEGTEFQLIPRLIETGAICLIDEMFLECHYDQRGCCPGRRSWKHRRKYADCLELFYSIRNRGVLVHQWW